MENPINNRGFRWTTARDFLESSPTEIECKGAAGEHEQLIGK